MRRPTVSSFFLYLLTAIAFVTGAVGVRAVVDGRPNCLNFAANNFLGVAGSPGVAAACRATIDKYGVGSCGPRGFYGTIDVHLQLEVCGGGAPCHCFCCSPVHAPAPCPVYTKTGPCCAPHDNTSPCPYHAHVAAAGAPGSVHGRPGGDPVFV